LNAFSIGRGTHYAVTKNALQKVFPDIVFGKVKKVFRVPLYKLEYVQLENPQLGDLILDGVRDVDFYQFSVVPVHAQTEVERELSRYSEQELKEVRRRDIDKFMLIQEKRLAEIKEKMKNGDFRMAGYQIGLYLHSLHDLVTHSGITNSQHRMLDNLDQSPDKNVKAFEEACQYTIHFFQAMPDLFGYEYARRWHDELVSHKNCPMLTAREKRSLFGRGKDIYWSSLAYILSREQRKALDYLDQVQWPYREMIANCLKVNSKKHKTLSNASVEQEMIREHQMNWKERTAYWPGRAIEWVLEKII
jgi:hypothetical protein